MLRHVQVGAIENWGLAVVTAVVAINVRLIPAISCVAIRIIFDVLLYLQVNS